jgi:hypothetical protein
VKALFGGLLGFVGLCGVLLCVHLWVSEAQVDPRMQPEHWAPLATLVVGIPSLCLAIVGVWVLFGGEDSEERSDRT